MQLAVDRENYLEVGIVRRVATCKCLCGRGAPYTYDPKQRVKRVRGLWMLETGKLRD